MPSLAGSFPCSAAADGAARGLQAPRGTSCLLLGSVSASLVGVSKGAALVLLKSICSCGMLEKDSQPTSLEENSGAASPV